jgi:lysophospholipid acyltransferase (LPLAT)-like uncharacterized protein
MPVIKLIFIKMARSWYATGQMWWEGKILMVQFLYLLSGLAGIICAIKMHKKEVKKIAVLFAVILYFWAITVLVLSVLRYMVPAMGIIIIFSSVFINEILNFIFKKCGFTALNNN